MVVATEGKQDKDEYRRFKIKFKDTPDDVDMIYDILYRRFHNDWEHPQLIVVDGGKPQVSAALRVIEDLNLDITVIGLAKKSETIVYKENGNFKEISPGKNDQGLRLLMRLRDEAHRFAQSYHHLLRLKSLGV
jgi:excinuclease ABC subunit C